MRVEKLSPEALQDYPFPIADEACSMATLCQWKDLRILLKAFGIFEKGWGELGSKTSPYSARFDCTLLHTAFKERSPYVLRIALYSGLKLEESYGSQLGTARQFGKEIIERSLEDDPNDPFANECLKVIRTFENEELTCPECDTDDESSVDEDADDYDADYEYSTNSSPPPSYEEAVHSYEGFVSSNEESDGEVEEPPAKRKKTEES